MHARLAQLLGLALALGIPAAGSLAAGAGPLPPPPEGWEPLTFERVEQATRYEAAEGALRAESRCSASALVRSLEDGALARTPLLRWRWRVEQPMPAHDERTKGGDDFAARVYVLFRFDPQQASLWERARHRLGRTLLDREPPGRAVSYVWSSREPAGTSWASPYTSSARLISMGRGPLTGWRPEQVDPRADYRRLFGSEPTEAVAVALMTDTDDTCSHAVAWFDDFALAPAAAPEPPAAPGRNSP